MLCSELILRYIYFFRKTFYIAYVEVTADAVLSVTPF